MRAMFSRKELIIAAAIFTVYVVTDAEKCDRIKIGNEYYKRQLIATFDGYPTGMVFDPKTENLFFVLKKGNYTKGVYLLKHGALGIKEIRFSEDMYGQSVAVDVYNNVIYFGTNMGLVTLDNEKGTVNSERPIGDDDIRAIFIHKPFNDIYLTLGQEHEIFRYMNASNAVKKYERINKGFNFVLDSQYNAFFEYIDGRMYFFGEEFFEPIQYKGFTRSLKYTLTMNEQDEAIVGVKGSLFKLTTKSILPLRIAQLGFKITAIAFDSKNNFIIGTKGKIYRYKLFIGTEACQADDYFMATL